MIVDVNHFYESLSKANNDTDVMHILETFLLHPQIVNFTTFAHHPVVQGYVSQHPETGKVLELFQFGTIKTYLGTFSFFIFSC